MPVGVVVGLEVVEVEHRERDRVALALGALELARELLVEGAPVADAGQRVDAGQLLELGQRRRALDRDRRLARQQLDQLQLALRQLRRLAASRARSARPSIWSADRQRLEGAGAPLRRARGLGARAVSRSPRSNARRGARAVARRQLGPGDAEADVDGRDAASRPGSPSTGPRRPRRPARTPRRTARTRTRRRPRRARAGSSPRRAGAASSVSSARSRSRRASSTCAVTAAASTRRVSRSSARRRVRLLAGDAQRADALPAGGHRRPGVEAEAHGVVGEARVRGRVGDHERLVAGDRVRAEGVLARRLVAVGHPEPGLRPLAVGVDEVERGDRRAQQARGQRDELVEGRAPRRSRAARCSRSAARRWGSVAATGANSMTLRSS